MVPHRRPCDPGPRCRGGHPTAPSLLTTSFEEGPRRTRALDTGLAHPDPCPWLGGALVLLMVFFLVGTRTNEPLVAVAVAVLRRRTVAVGNLAGLTTFPLMSSLTYLLTLALQDVLLMGAVLTGVMITVIGAVSVVAANFTPKIIGRYGQKALVVTALIFQGAGTLLIAVAGAHGPSWAIALVGIVIGALGHIVAIVAIVGCTVTATSGLPESEQGLATGLTTTSQQGGLALGSPLIASVLAAGLASSGQAGTSGPFAGLTVAIVVNGLVVLASAVAVAVFLPGQRLTATPAEPTETVAARAWPSTKGTCEHDRSGNHRRREDRCRHRPPRHRRRIHRHTREPTRTRRAAPPDLRARRERHPRNTSRCSRGRRHGGRGGAIQRDR